MTADGTTMAAVQTESVSHLYVASIGDPSGTRQITTGTNRQDGTLGIAWTPDGRVVYTSSASGTLQIWITDATGANPKQLTDRAAVYGDPRVTADGKSILYSADGKDGWVWMMDLDGANQRPLATGKMTGRAIVSADMNWVYYTMYGAQLLEFWRMPFSGGTPERLTGAWNELGIKQDGVFYHPTMTVTDISPDGTKALGFYADPDTRGNRVGVFPIGGGTPIRLDIIQDGAVFTRDGQSVIYRDARTGRMNLFRQSVKGGTPVQLTSFTTDPVRAFAVSTDGKQIAMSRGHGTSDVVLIRSEKKD